MPAAAAGAGHRPTRHDVVMVIEAWQTSGASGDFRNASARDGVGSRDVTRLGTSAWPVELLTENWLADEPALRETPPSRQAWLTVVREWLGHKEATGLGVDELILAADDDRTFVAVSTTVGPILGFEPSELIGRRVDDIVHLERAEAIGDRWSEFRQGRRERDVIVLLSKAGAIVYAEYDARADFPLRGCHVSRLRILGVR